MPTLLMTHSEEIFRRICHEAGYYVERPMLRCSEGVKTADFIVLIGDHRVIAEVEELRPNNDDIRQIRMMRSGNPVGGGCTIGARPRQHIRRAAKQLRPYAQKSVPLIIVLYDNVRIKDTRVAYPMFYLQPHDIDAAMYGDRVAHISLARRVRLCADQNGGRRTCTVNEKNYISAVAAMSDHDDRTVFFYHNCFANIPLAPPMFRGANFHHLAKVRDEPWKWQPIE